MKKEVGIKDRYIYIYMCVYINGEEKWERRERGRERQLNVFEGLRTRDFSRDSFKPFLSFSLKTQLFIQISSIFPFLKGIFIHSFFFIQSLLPCFCLM